MDRSELLILQAVYVQSGKPEMADPIHDASLSVNARMLWMTLRDVSVRKPPAMLPTHTLCCGEAEAMAAIHELVSTGWMVLRWVSPMMAMAMILEWPREMLDHQRDWIKELADDA